MHSQLRRHLSFANVAAAVALFVALGGAAYAGLNLPKNSVGASEIEKNAVRAAEIAANAVRSGEVKEGSLSCAEFDPALAPCAATSVRATTATIPMSCQESQPVPGTFILTCTGTATVKAPCNPGEHATGGGWTPGSASIGTATASVSVTESRPDPAAGTPDGWSVRAQAGGGNSGPSPGLQRPPDPDVTVYAVCEA